MAGSAALLIDLENFFIGRENNYHEAHPGETYEFPIDLESLCNFAREIAAGQRLVVRRAYANFNDRRPGGGERTWDYYLHSTPRFLMEQGVEPVQVFRFPGGGNKNAADMRLAMDATVLRQPPTGIELFILVTGDADFIPVVLELQRAGARVVVIGVEGCTNAIFQHYCDRFEFFEGLLAAREVQRADDREPSPARLAESPPASDDPDVLGDVPGADIDAVDDAASAEAQDGHSAEIYSETLRTGMPRCYVVGNSDLRRIADAIFETVVDGAGTRVAIVHQDLLSQVTDLCHGAGMEEAVRKVRDVTFQLFKAGCFQCAAEGAQFGLTDFHWSKPAMLARSIETPLALRRRCFDYLIKLLGRRLELRGASQRVQLQPAVELLCGADPLDEDVALVRELVGANA